jgi:hypothetical protein
LLKKYRRLFNAPQLNEYSFTQETVARHIIIPAYNPVTPWKGVDVQSALWGPSAAAKAVTTHYCRLFKLN